MSGGLGPHTMVLLAAAFTLLALAAGAYETLSLQTRKFPSITELVRRHPHAAILIFTAVGLAFGYALGQGGS